MSIKTLIPPIAAIVALGSLQDSVETPPRQPWPLTTIEKRDLAKKKARRREIKRRRKQRPYRLIGKKQAKPASPT